MKTSIHALKNHLYPILELSGLRYSLLFKRHRLLIAGFLFSIALDGVAQSVGLDVSETQAKSIALAAAGCKRAEDCEIRGSLEGGNWVFVVSFVKGRNTNGEPIFVPGGWIGITVNARGKVIDRMPGT